jgi:hypothetical protein
MEPLSITVAFDKVEALRLAMKIAFLWHSKAKAWAESENGSLVFYWHTVAGAHPLPVALDADGVADLAMTWLKERPVEAYGQEPDHDGDNARGFRLSNGGPSITTGKERERYAVVAISPEWIEYHK